MERNTFRSCSIFFTKFFKLADNKNCVNTLKKNQNHEIMKFKPLTKAVRLPRYLDFLKHINNFSERFGQFLTLKIDI